MKSSPVLILFSILFSSFNLFGQAEDIQAAINKDVWYPFMESYAAQDADAFMAIHTEDVIRVSRDGKRIQVGEEYAESMARNTQHNKAKQRSRTIEFSFLERIAKEDVAFEVGYYKVISSEPGKETKTYIGKFHVILKKVEDKWQIFVDSDTSNKDSMTIEDFNSGDILK